MSVRRVARVRLLCILTLYVDGDWRRRGALVTSPRCARVLSRVLPYHVLHVHVPPHEREPVLARHKSPVQSRLD